MPDFITAARRRGLYINGHFRFFIRSFNFKGSRFELYFLRVFPRLLKALLKATALFIALLIPSNELGLISPAASPIRKIPSPPVQKLESELGRSTMQASVKQENFHILRRSHRERRTCRACAAYNTVKKIHNSLHSDFL